MIAILVVCQGNICRSPALQGCLQKIIDEHHKTDKYYVDSCGLYSSFCGQGVDSRVKKAAKKQGIELSHQAREFAVSDFNTFDYILPVTEEIRKELCSLSQNPQDLKKIHLVTEFSQKYYKQDIEDPYRKGEEGFDLMLNQLCEIAREIFSYLELK